MNSTILLGRTTSQIELKQTQAGKSVATFSLAVKRPYTKDTTDFITVCAWGKQAELVSQYVNKGDQVCIRGYITTRTWEDNQGNKRHATEVVADEITFVGKNASEPKNEPKYIPDAYKTPNFEEIPNEEGLPF